MRLRRVLVSAVMAGLIAGVATTQLPGAVAHPQDGVIMPTTEQVKDLPDLVPALDAEGNVVACIKNPLKFDDPETFWWPPGLDPVGLVGTYEVIGADGETSIVTESIDVTAAIANAERQVEAQKDEPKDC